jgi:hypothetical protein
MAAKRKTKRTTTAREDLAQPTKWRLQHGGFTAPVREADPDTGSTVVHRRAVDTLGLMLAHGTITQGMYDAGSLFRTLFRRAALDSMTRSQLIRLPGKTTDALSDRTIDARRKVADALDVLGGHDSAAGSCAWYVLGLETSVREWAMRQGWGGRPVPPTQAQGMLVATLSVLAGHFGLVPRMRAA